MQRSLVLPRLPRGRNPDDELAGPEDESQSLSGPRFLDLAMS